MFSKLKTFILGDKRPVVRSVDLPAIGTLVYSDDDEAWLSDPEAAVCGFGFYIAGDWDADGPEIRPAKSLIEHAAQIASDPETFVRSVRALIASQLEAVKSLHADRHEIEQLGIYRVALMWPERPNDGEIELRTPGSKRMWHCSYLNRTPTPPLIFSGLDV